MKRAAQSAVARKRGPPIMPADISFRGTHAGSPGSDLHGLASLTGTCPAQCRFSDAYSGSGGACGERGGRTFTGTCSQKKKVFMFIRCILFLSGLWGLSRLTEKESVLNLIYGR